MSTSRFTARERRVLLLGTAIIATLFGTFKVFPVWNAWRLDQRFVATKRVSDAAQLRATVASLAVSLDSLEARGKRLLGASSAFIVCDSTAQAPSILTALVAASARDAMFRIGTMESGVVLAEGGSLPRVTLEMSGVVDIVGLAELLRRLESGSPLVAVRRLRVRPQDASAAPGQPETLMVSLSLEALVLERLGGPT